MAEASKTLAQSNPSAATLTDLYTAPADTSTIASSIFVVNRGGSGSAKFRIAIAKAGEADSLKQYIYYDLPIDENDTFVATVGITLEATDVVRIETDIATLSFNLMGVEIT